MISPPTHSSVAGMHGQQFPHIEEFTHLINDTPHEVSTPITQEPGQGPKDLDVTLIQELGDCISCLIEGHICHYVFHEMFLEHQDIGNFRQSIQLQGCLHASKVYIQEVHQSGGHNWVLRHFEQIALMLQAMHTGLNGLLHLIDHA